MPAGRPTKYRPEMCKQAINFMAQGFSIEALAGELDICKDTIYEWIQIHREFSDAINKGRVKCQLFWEKLGIMGTAGKIPGFQGSTWYANMRNRFAWQSQVTIQQNVQHQVKNVTKQDVQDAIDKDPFIEVEFKKEEK